jgi:hypothetical protein
MDQTPDCAVLLDWRQTARIDNGGSLDDGKMTRTRLTETGGLSMIIARNEKQADHVAQGEPR